MCRCYLGRETDKLAYQVVNYQQCDSWSYGDLLRLVHREGFAGSRG